MRSLPLKVSYFFEKKHGMFFLVFHADDDTWDFNSGTYVQVDPYGAAGAVFLGVIDELRQGFLR